MATEEKATAEDGGSKPITITRRVALAPSPPPGIDDPWGRVAAARRAFVHKAQTHPEHAPEYLQISEILRALADPRLRFDSRGRATDDEDAATDSFLDEVTKVLHRYLGASQSRKALAFRAADSFAFAVKAALLAPTLREAAESVLLHLEYAPLLWGRSGKLMGRGPKRPPKLDLETVEKVLGGVDAYGDDRGQDDPAGNRGQERGRDDPAGDLRALSVLARNGDYNRVEWQRAHDRFDQAIDSDKLARKVLNAVGVKRRWVGSLFEERPGRR